MTSAEPAAASEPAPAGGFWLTRWSYAQATALVGGLCGAAWAAQAVAGTLAVALPPPPWNWTVACGPFLALAVARWLRPRSLLLDNLGGIPVAVLSLVALALFASPVAIWKEGPEAPAWLASLGLAHPLSTLPFAVALALVMANLALCTARRLQRREPGWIRFAVLHTGLLTVLAAGAAGTASLERARVVLTEGAGFSALADRGGRPLALPVELALDDFVLESFPPRAAVARMRPGGWDVVTAETFLGPDARVAVAGLTLAVREWLPGAAVIDGRPTAFAETGAGPAARVAVTAADGGALGEGWLHAPSAYGEPLFLALPDGRALMMEAPRPRRFASRLRVREGGVERPYELVVNRPLHAGGWVFYQTSYDERLGAASRTSVLEAVEDRSLPVVYVGIFLVLAGIAAHLWHAAAAVRPPERAP